MKISNSINALINSWEDKYIDSSQVHRRVIKVTEWIQDEIAITKVDFIETLNVWQKVYKTVANLAKAGYLHKDLLFNNV